MNKQLSILLQALIFLAFLSSACQNKQTVSNSNTTNTNANMANAKETAANAGNQNRVENNSSSKQAAAQEFYVNGREHLEGFYTLKGAVPAEFKDIENLELRHGGEKNAPFYGSIKLNGKGTKYSLLLPTLNDKNISLKTEVLKDISYEFTGTFTRLDLAEAIEANSKEVVLTGKLKKLSAGKVVAETDAEFTYYQGT